MRVDALDPKYNLEARFMKDGYLDIPLECEVYTFIGRILERLQIVEALQFINIIFNDMSLIGNRPLPKKNIEMLKKFNGWEERFDSPAGITGISQVVGKLNLQARDRIELECLYSKSYLNGNILMVDLLIVFYTVTFIFLGKSLKVEDARRLLLRSLE
jgi:lipopolysaccharide/colanic/teichoic acid biosynthesis glycosyltransferase